ncbi:hypothetical protein Golax_011815 [Gossypium laxum]|uniref:Uncharacterized protein n=1 Tax=Gossypium laxum TaxID=34288 RepID=A0A7J8ZLL7_9ROSI|nr:hypothetical protein [Gossypium laxum]
MKKRFLDKVEDNAIVRIWSEKTQQEKGNILTEGYMIQVDKAYSRAANDPTFLKRLMSIAGMSEQWVTARIKQKGDGKCIPWKSLRDLILAHPNMKKRVNAFALSIYGLVIFAKALGHIDDAVLDLFDRLNKKVSEDYQVCTTLASLVSQPLLEDKKGLLSSILRELLFIEGIRGYPRRDDIFEEK